MTDMSATIIPRSDQMNADDLIAGPRTITIREVKISPGTEQPVAVFFNGDDGKPYLPCKSMRRVMVAVWGADAGLYTGRGMTLYRDPSVTWGGMEVGGIRISHMSHITETMVIVLTATKKTRKPFTVKPLKVAAAPPPAPSVDIDDPPKIETKTPEQRARQWVDNMILQIASTDENGLHELAGNAAFNSYRKRLAEAYPGLDAEIAGAMKDRFNALIVPAAE